ncbi:MAG: hypothetical protein CSA66_04185 [Proteobacteria bacterium]|nr:MAG: hypothetical protein CSA66_04185 [Pseudomonadota bacterium]
MSAIAKRCSQMLGIVPGTTVALSVADDEVAGAVMSLFGSAGVEVCQQGADMGLVELAEAPGHAVDPAVRALIERVAPGGAVVAWLRAELAGHANTLAAHVGPMLDLEGVVVEPLGPGDGVLVKGVRRRRLDNKKTKRLRGMGHDIEPSVLVGRGGLSPETVAAARAAVERHGLIKVKLTPQCELDKGRAAVEIAWGTGSKLVQRVGKTALIYRPDVKLDPPVSHRRR